MNRPHCLSQLLVAILVLGVPLGIQAQEHPRNPVLTEKSLEVPLKQSFELPGKPSSAGQESEAAPPPSGLPPIGGATPVDKIPDPRIGDLKCRQPVPGDNDWERCESACEARPATPCVVKCVFRKSGGEECNLYVECTSACDEIPEIPETEAPTGR